MRIIVNFGAVPNGKTGVVLIVVIDEPFSISVPPPVPIVPVVPVEIEVVLLKVSVPGLICVTVALPLNVPSGNVTAEPFGEIFKVPIVDPLRLVVDANPEHPTVVPPLLALVLSVFVVTCAAPVWMVKRVAPSSTRRAVGEGVEKVLFCMSVL